MIIQLPILDELIECEVNFDKLKIIFPRALLLMNKYSKSYNRMLRDVKIKVLIHNNSDYNTCSSIERMYKNNIGSVKSETVVPISIDTSGGVIMYKYKFNSGNYIINSIRFEGEISCAYVATRSRVMTSIWRNQKDGVLFPETINKNQPLLMNLLHENNCITITIRVESSNFKLSINYQNIITTTTNSVISIPVMIKHEIYYDPMDCYDEDTNQLIIPLNSTTRHIHLHPINIKIRKVIMFDEEDPIAYFNWREIRKDGISFTNDTLASIKNPSEMFNINGTMCIVCETPPTTSEDIVIVSHNIYRMTYSNGFMRLE